jgi:hypothetical protein
VPFSDFEGSPRLILDLHPGRNGTYGQVWQDWPGRLRVPNRIVIEVLIGGSCVRPNEGRGNDAPRPHSHSN